MNQEIKRVLTEVLLKVTTVKIFVFANPFFMEVMTFVFFFEQVTDELFDKIATKVLDEDNLTAEGNDGVSGSLNY